MRHFKGYIIAAILLGSTGTIMADDYALTERYFLHYDMKAAQKQQSLVVQMQELFNSPSIDNSDLNRLEMKFSRQLTGLIDGDDTLRLKGTKLSAIRNELEQVKDVWKETQVVIKKALKSSEYREEAQQYLNRLLQCVSSAVIAYDKSYQRYKQRSQLSAIVNSHINHGKSDRLAFNSIK